ncbi:unnamed protein product [Cyprideis torosa]|uniref:Uncharacterized protein n=1 Tax=Cyprideis torosa TaxID=163714 RepID=A0A7R8WG34_9CRUS|nr:unnamed protein product [Cyprideis torosa]CAG0897611.1 unnamed protein product [Cyprideis torosa]
MSLKSSITLIVLVIGFYCAAVYAVPGEGPCSTDEDCTGQYEICNDTSKTGLCVCANGYVPQLKPNQTEEKCYGDYNSMCNVTNKDCRKGLVCKAMDNHFMCECGDSIQQEWIEALEDCYLVRRLNQGCSIAETEQCYPFEKTFCDMNLEPPKCQCTEGLKEKDGKCENGSTSLTGYSLLLALSIMFTRVLA